MVVTLSVLRHVRDLHGARVEGLAVEVRGAGLADVDAAAVLRAGEPDEVADHPEQADVVLDVDGDGLPVEDEGVLRHVVSSPQ